MPQAHLTRGGGCRFVFAHTIAFFTRIQLVNCTGVLRVTSSLSVCQMHVECLLSVVMLHC
jgi:hypothetical protein